MKHVEEKISVYLDGELSSKENVEVERHIEECEDCKAYMQKIQSLKNKVKSAYHSLTIPINMEENVLFAIKKQEMESKSLVNFMVFGMVSFLALIIAMFYKSIAVSLKVFLSMFHISLGIVDAVNAIISITPYLQGILIAFVLSITALSIWFIRRLLFLRQESGDEAYVNEGY